MFAEPGYITWGSCSSPGAHGNLTSATFINNPVVPGLNTTVIAWGTLDKTITSGTWTLTGAYSSMPLFHASGDLCTDSVIELPLRSGAIYVTGLNCPQSSGLLQIEQKALFYYAPPSGYYFIHCEMKDQDEEEVLCLDITIPM